MFIELYIALSWKIWKNYKANRNLISTTNNCLLISGLFYDNSNLKAIFNKYIFKIIVITICIIKTCTVRNAIKSDYYWMEGQNVLQYSPLLNVRLYEHDKRFQNKTKKLFFFYRDFLSETLTIQGTVIIPLYHFHTLPNMRDLSATWHLRWLHVFLISLLVISRLLFDEIYNLREIPSDWKMIFYLFIYFYFIKVFTI